MPSAHAFTQDDVALPPGDCANLPANQYDRAVNCSTLALSVAARDLSQSGAESLQTLRVTNAVPVDCTATSTLELLVVPRPTLVSLLPSPLACVDQGNITLTLDGSGFVRILNETDGDPTVNLSPSNSSLPTIVLVCIIMIVLKFSNYLFTLTFFKKKKILYFCFILKKTNIAISFIY